MPCRVLNFSSQPVDALNSRSAASVFNCVEKCFAFSWRSGPEIRVPVDLCWINQAYRALSNCSSLASFRDFPFNPSLVSMLSVNFKILSLFFLMPEICCLLMPNSWAKFVPFSALSKREIIICLSLIDKTARFRFVGMFSFEFTIDRSCLYITHMAGTNQAWNSLGNKTIEPIRYQLNASEYFCLVALVKFWKAPRITRCFNSLLKGLFMLFGTLSFHDHN